MTSDMNIRHWQEIAALVDMRIGAALCKRAFDIRLNERTV